MILTPNFSDIPNSVITILQLPIIQTHLKKLANVFEGVPEIKEALETFVINHPISRATTIVLNRQSTIVSPQDPQNYMIYKKNYEMVGSSSHYTEDENQLRLDQDEVEILIKKFSKNPL